MAVIVKETRLLKGLVTLQPLVATDYYFELQQLSGTKLPNALDNVVLEEVFINVESGSEQCRIFLPAISTFNLGWNAKIYITYVSGGEKPQIFSYEGSEITPSDFINGSNPSVILDTTGQGGLFRITGEHNWAYFSTPIPA